MISAINEEVFPISQNLACQSCLAQLVASSHLALHIKSVEFDP